MRPRVVAVLPAFNEEATVRRVVEEVYELVGMVVVVDDGSRDGTPSRADLDGMVQVLRHPRNLGVGAALRTGLRKAFRLRPDAVVLLDSDGQHDPQEIPSLLEPVLGGSAHLAVGCRDFNRMSPVRRASNLLTAKLLRSLFGVEVADVQCGFRALRGDLVPHLLPAVDGYPWASEQLIRAQSLKLKIQGVEVSTLPRLSGQSHVKPLRDTLSWLGMMANVTVVTRQRGNP